MAAAADATEVLSSGDDDDNRRHNSDPQAATDAEARDFLGVADGTCTPRLIVRTPRACHAPCIPRPPPSAHPYATSPHGRPMQLKPFAPPPYWGQTRPTVQWVQWGR